MSKGMLERDVHPAESVITRESITKSQVATLEGVQWEGGVDGVNRGI